MQPAERPLELLRSKSNAQGLQLLAFAYPHMLPQALSEEAGRGGGEGEAGGVCGRFCCKRSHRRRARDAGASEGSALVAAARDYCLSTSIHGLRYIAEDGRHWSERLLWVALSVAAAACAARMASEVANRYWSAPTMTVVEGTNHPVANIPFPSVALCDGNRARWTKALDFQKRHHPEASPAAVSAFKDLVAAVSVMEFGDFDKIPSNLTSDLQALEELESYNITQLMLEVMPACEEFFVGECWWRNAEFDCCQLFELQRTELGFCFAFNSEISEAHGGEEAAGAAGAGGRRPRRTSSKGLWSGLRAAVNASDDLPPNAEPPGIRVLVTSPYSFPSDGAHVAGGLWASVAVGAQDTYSTARVRRLHPALRGCLYRDEGPAAFRQRTYAHASCVHECQRTHTQRLCGCTPFFYPPAENSSYCNITGMLCLKEHNDVFNFMMPAPGNAFFDDERGGMQCDCLPDCDAQDFSTEVYAVPLGDNFLPARKTSKFLKTVVFLDVHFKSIFVVRYRTDLVFGWLDLLVALGGIVGLFMGSSALSVAELLYHATLRRWARHWPSPTPTPKRAPLAPTPSALPSAWAD